VTINEFNLLFLQNPSLVIVIPIVVAVIGWVPAIAVSLVAYLSARSAAKLANEATRESAKTAALVAEKNSERKILVENITQERAKWREKIRTKSIEVYKAAMKGDQVWLAELKLTFATSLNPCDKEDGFILDVIERLKDEKNRDPILEEFSDRISLLLKHDWQRAKKEAEPGNLIEVQRLTLQELRCWRICGRDNHK
jgi:hypothetical protein